MTYRLKNNEWIPFKTECQVCKKTILKKDRPSHSEQCKGINTYKKKKPMPVQQIRVDGKVMYRWGDHGKAYPTRAEAERQAQAAYAHGYREPKKKENK